MPTKPTMPKDAARFHIGYWIVAFLGLMLFQYVYTTTQQVANIPYSQFEQLLREGKVAEIGISDRFIQGKLKDRQGGKRVVGAAGLAPALPRQLDQYNVRYTGRIESTFLRDILSWVLPVLLFFGVWAYLGRRMAQGLGGP